MSMTIALLGLSLLLLAVLLLRPSPAVSTPRLIPVSPPPQSSRRVSFSLTETSYTLSLPVHRRWSSTFHKRESLAPDSPRAPQPEYIASPADQFGRILPSDVHSSKLSRRFSTPLRLSFTTRRRSSSASASIRLDQVDARTLSPPSLASTTQSPRQRIRFVNPFARHSRSRTLSPPSGAFKSPDPSVMSSSSPPPARRQKLVNKFKSIFKPIPPEPSPIIHSKPIFATINTKLRRKPVARTQPYGPPWNAPMPVPDFTVFQHSLQKPAQSMSPPLQTSRRRSVNRGSYSEITSVSPGQLSPHTFINELDEKLSLLQQQRI